MLRPWSGADHELDFPLRAGISSLHPTPWRWSSKREMSAMQTTPETDAEISEAWEAVGISPALVPADFARQLERERNEMISLLRSEKIARNHIIERALQVERERDAARALAGELIASIRINAKHGAFATATIYELEEWLVPFVARLNPALGVECNRRGKKK